MMRKIADSEQKVKDALQVWVDWMRRDRSESELGFGRCVGFDGGGGTSSWDDFARKVDNNMAINVQAIYDGLTFNQRIAVDHFNLGAVWKSNRFNIEDEYATALIAIEIGLRRRMLI